ncbi:MAG: GGDEF domain-containing protein [Halieaceae bacterium]|nr:GGDEF domain-containing protein [Halieaceae bacterium]
MDFRAQIEQRKSYLIQGFSLAMIALVLMFAAIRLLTQTPRPIMLPLVTLSVLIYSWCFYRTRYRNSTLAPASALVGSLTISILGVSAINGGFTAPMFVFIPMGPLLATLMIGPRAGLVTMAGVALVVTGMMVLQGMGFQYPIGPLLSADRDILRGFTMLLTVVLVGACVWHYATQTELMAEAIYKQATHDYLTGLLNRRAIDARLEEEIDRAGRSGTWLSLIIADVDHFKHFNDNHGHIAGDQALKVVADQLQSRFRRSSDSVGRWGGEEFAVILPFTDPEQAERLANEVREEIASQVIFDSGRERDRVTITMGVGSIKDRRRIDVRELLELADNALYTGKEQGRNQVSVAAMRGLKPKLVAVDFSNGKKNDNAGGA